MSDKETIPSSVEEPWESEQFGENENFKRVTPERAAELDDALGLQAISIRLDKSLIESYKALGKFHGVGYQPLMRDALKRFADGEMRAIVMGLVGSQKKLSTSGKPHKSPASRNVQRGMKKAA